METSYNEEDLKYTEEKKEAIKKTREELLAHHKATQAHFLEKAPVSLGDKLEEGIYDFLKSKEQWLSQFFTTFDTPELWRISTQEVTIAPIVQLAEMQGLGAAAVYAERILKLEDADYVNQFEEQISRLGEENREELASFPASELQLSLAKLYRICTYSYSLYRMNAIKGGLDFLDEKRQKALKAEVAEYVRVISGEILQFLALFAEENDQNIEQLKVEFQVKEKKTPLKERWKQEIKRLQQTEKDEVLAREYILETFETIEYDMSHMTDEDEVDPVGKFKNLLSKGIHFMDNLHNRLLFDCIPFEHDAYASNLKRLKKLELSDIAVQHDLDRYISLREDAVLLRYLVLHEMPHITLENIQALGGREERLGLMKYQRENILSLREWNLSMLQRCEALMKVLWHDFNDFAYLRDLSLQQLDKLLHYMEPWAGVKSVSKVKKAAYDLFKKDDVRLLDDLHQFIRWDKAIRSALYCNSSEEITQTIHDAIAFINNPTHIFHLCLMDWQVPLGVDLKQKSYSLPIGALKDYLTLRWHVEQWTNKFAISAVAEVREVSVPQAIKIAWVKKLKCFIDEKKGSRLFAEKLNSSFQDVLDTQDSLSPVQQSKSFHALQMHARKLLIESMTSLSETMNLGAVAIVAERITQLDNNLDKIHKFGLSLRSHQTNSDRLPDFVEVLAFFSYNYSLRKFYAEGAPELIDIDHQRAIRAELAAYVRTIAEQTIVFLKKFSEEEDINLNELKNTFQSEEMSDGMSEILHRRWLNSISTEDMSSRDSQRSREFVQGTFNNLERKITDGLWALRWSDDNAKRNLQSNLEEAIQFIENLGVGVVFRSIKFKDSSLNEDSCRPVACQKTRELLGRYVALCKDAALYQLLSSKGMDITMEELVGLDSVFKKELNNWLDRNSFLVSLSSWSLAMLHHRERLQLLFYHWKPFNEYDYLRQFSSAELGRFLDTLQPSDCGWMNKLRFYLIKEGQDSLLNPLEKFSNLEKQIMKTLSANSSVWTLPKEFHLMLLEAINWMKNPEYSALCCRMNWSENAEKVSRRAQNFPINSEVLKKYFSHYARLREGLKLWVDSSNQGLDAIKSALPLQDFQWLKAHPGITLQSWTPAMFYHREKMVEFFKVWPDFSDYETLNDCAFDDLGSFLQLLMKPSRHFKSIKDQYVFAKHLPHSGWLSTVLQSPAANSKVRRMLSLLSPTAKENLLARKPDLKAMDFFKSLSELHNKQQIAELLLTSSLLQSACLGSKSPEMSLLFQLSYEQLVTLFMPEDGNVQQAKILLSINGIACHAKGYCSLIDQWHIPIEILPLVQEVMLKKKIMVPQEMCELLATPAIIRAYKAQFFDADWLGSCTVSDVKMLAQHVEEAQEKGFEHVWDPRFDAFIRSKLPAVIQQGFFAVHAGGGRQPINRDSPVFK
ncbi:MAG: hypothetical protein WC785_01740 [Tatlockia sp.]|jgi:hypothetical protein